MSALDAVNAIGGFRVLLVDDEPDLIEIITYELELGGAEVTCANNGRQAMALVDSETFDIVVTDISMPNGSGLELLAAIRKKGKSVPVVLMSGFSNITPAMAAEAGAADFIAKPFELVGLSKRLQACLQQRRKGA